MPSTSEKQARFMAAVANSPEFAKKVKVPQSVGKDFHKKDKAMKKYNQGESVEMTEEEILRQAKDDGTSAKPTAAMLQEIKDRKDREKAKKAPTTYTTMGQKFKAGGSVKRDGIAQRGKTRGRIC